MDLQWALPSSGHPYPCFPPSSSWGIGHLCPVWWQRGNCLTAHTTDTHICFIHAFGLDLGNSSLCPFVFSGLVHNHQVNYTLFQNVLRALIVQRTVLLGFLIVDTIYKLQRK